MRRAPWAMVAVIAVVAGCGALSEPGPQQTQTRAVTGATSVLLATSGQLTVSHGQTASLSVTAGRDVQRYLTSDVRGSTLELGVASAHPARLGEIRYELVLPDLTGLTVAGSGDATASDFSPADLQLSVQGSGAADVSTLRTRRLVVRISGSGNVHVSGTADEQDVDISGSGSYSAGGLDTGTARVTVSGSGNADVTVQRTLQAQVSGSGNILYTGDARVQATTSGSGTVRRR